MPSPASAQTLAPTPTPPPTRSHISPAPSSTQLSSRALLRGRPWHNSSNDRLTRKLMMLRLRRLHPALATTAATTDTNATPDDSTSGGSGPSLVQRLEWMLYNAANSLHEYTHELTLQRRVQALVTQLETRKPVEKHTCGVKRGQPDSGDGDIQKNSAGKRQRLSAPLVDTLAASSNASVFLLDNDENLVANVLGFLSGREILRLRSVNRFIHSVAPRMVRSLYLETRSSAFKHFKSGDLTALLLDCSKLTSLTITSKAASTMKTNLNAAPAVSGTIAASVPATRMPAQAPSRRLPRRRSSANSTDPTPGQLLLDDAARAFELGGCPELRVLDLGSPLDYFADSDDVLRCLEAFAAGRLRAPHAKPLRHLKLDSTYLGDARLARLADAFELRNSSTGKSCFGALEVLVLRNNFIGEAGCQALLRLLRHTPKLRMLDVSGNILTDLDVVALADWIDPCSSTEFLDVSSRFGAAARRELGRTERDGRVEVARSAGIAKPAAATSSALELRLLLLQDNFIGREGQEALVSALKSRQALESLGAGEKEAYAS